MTATGVAVMEVVAVLGWESWEQRLGLEEGWQGVWPGVGCGFPCRGGRMEQGLGLNLGRTGPGSQLRAWLPLPLPRAASWQGHSRHPGGLHRWLGDLRGHRDRTAGPGDRSPGYAPRLPGGAAPSTPHTHPDPKPAGVSLGLLGRHKQRASSRSVNNVGILYANTMAKLLDCENVAKVSEPRAPSPHSCARSCPPLGTHAACGFQKGAPHSQTFCGRVVSKAARL